ncbi:unnamed protein product [Polarella glacialis]|uniref:Concentrative nucleoside transporter C-terminal domain-containing protein n=1 Tax=Polarella glacialis TaxID=89957 RepID=A0A813FTS4_POLGL|nr:unnamed protein product [Polarella glacialis]
MTTGFATIAGGVMAAYIAFGIPPEHLISASVMSCPAALAMSKLSYPAAKAEPTATTAATATATATAATTATTTAAATEFRRADPLSLTTEPSAETGERLVELADSSQYTNVFDAMASGASLAVGLVANIVANIIAFLGVLAFLNSVLQWAGNLVGVSGLTFDLVFSYVLWPVAFMMGVPKDDCLQVARLLGQKTFINEFVAYHNLSELRKQELISGKAEVIATYALCGFSNFGSIGVQIGGLSAIAPSRKTDFAELALRAMVTGTVACFMTACVASMLLEFE